MPSSMPGGRRRLLPILLAGAALLAPVALRAQTFDSTAGTAPSEKLSTPPNTDAINRPGAMERAYGQHPPAAHASHKSTKPVPRKSPGPQPH